ncbi:hypothetical protein ACMD2_03102, partial [Ananas comosus]
NTKSQSICTQPLPHPARARALPLSFTSPLSSLSKLGSLSAAAAAASSSSSSSPAEELSAAEKGVKSNPFHGAPHTLLRHRASCHSRKEEGVSLDPTFNVSVIFGKRDEANTTHLFSSLPLLVACARQMIEHMSHCGSSRALILSLGLKDHSQEILKDIISAVIENRLW